MNPSTTNIEERDQWRARINRALAELQGDLVQVDARVSEQADSDASAEPESVV